ncbi:MAG: alanine--tRNA ligase [Anaerolineaceae bacterium]|nr:alanine--tRNA ligase [Anaerolineaceae bacterium]
MKKLMTGAEIRQSFIDYFIERGHTFVRSSSLVPGGDQTLLFTNAGMVQFKDVFLGTDHRPYTRAVNSQKCMRVAGKHNDLDDVGRDDSHHTFFEMLGNWSFGDYYKKEAIEWAWDLLTGVWGLDKDRLYATCFKDNKGDIPTDTEAYENWIKQPGIKPEHVLYFGRKENFWEMADTGPCGPCSEIHIDLGAEFCNKKEVPGHICGVNGDCRRFLELWNLVFIQYNRLNATELEPLPATHVDTGMGFERIVSVLQGVYSNYRTDLISPIMDTVQKVTGDTAEQREANLTPYRVIADHGRAATFLIADGVVPGNTGRGYVCRMIIRRAARFGSKIGLNEPFLAKVAETVVEDYGEAYPELRRNRVAIINNLTREEERFKRTVESGVSQLQEMLDELKHENGRVLDGKKAFELYATHGLPLEITRDIAREQGLEVDEDGFKHAMEEHRLVSGAGKAFGPMGGEDVEVFRSILDGLIAEGKLTQKGVTYDPYHSLEVEGPLLAIVKDGISVSEGREGERVELIIPETCFYVEAGGQVSDTGMFVSVKEPRWEIRIDDTRRPAAGVIVHIGEVIKGHPHIDDVVIAAVDGQRRSDIMRNHTATHLLHAELHAVVGEHALQAGSLVAPDRLRFDFTHSEAVTPQQLEKIEAGVNRAILENYPLKTVVKPTAQAISEGAMALFGEKYGETVRTITIGEAEPFSYELCGGTHVSETGDIGIFLITSEGSAAAGVRRIEAVTGRGAYELIQRRFNILKETAAVLNSSIDETAMKAKLITDDLDETRKQAAKIRQELVLVEFNRTLLNVPQIMGVPTLAGILPNADMDTLRQMTDRFRSLNPSGVVVLGSVSDGRPAIIAAVTEDLVKRGLNAGDLVKSIAPTIGGSGGGRPTLAQAGGKDPSRLSEAMDKVVPFVKDRLSK